MRGGDRFHHGLHQNLPTGPLSSVHLVRVRRPLPRTGPVPWQPILALSGVAAAVIGMLFASLPPQVDVDLDAAGYHIAGQRLPPTGPGVFEGPGAAVVMVESGGQTRAAASTALNGVHMTGRCTHTRGASTESCRFLLGSRELVAVDTASRTGWHRRYDDGRTVEIRTGGGKAVPVPFAVGR